MKGRQSKKVKIYRPKKKNPETQIIEQLQSEYGSIDETKIEKFSDLPLSPLTLKGLEKNNYNEPTDIQRQTIGLALRGNDILGAAKTGSGKTLAFLIPILETLYCHRWSQMDGAGAVIITPTRELALQIFKELEKVGHYHDFSAGLVIGGKDLLFERKRMDRCNIVICTPGRLLDHLEKTQWHTSANMKILVLDEADRCLDLGFQKTMNSIIENLPQERQTLLFSATQTKSVKDLARLSLKDPVYISVHEHAAHATPENLQQSYVVCELEDKMPMIWSFIRNHLKQKIIVFFSSCKQVKYMYEAFCKMRPGVSLLALYGSLHQEKRIKIYESFCTKQHAVLFATDLAARGLDFPAIDWVVQMDCPEDTDAYIHRAGRTARFQRGGESLLVLLPSELGMVKKIEARRIPIQSITINPNRLQTPQRKLEALLAANVAFKETAQRAFVAYIKSVFLMKDKAVFNIKALNTDNYARSLGLAIPPRIRFLQRMQNPSSKQSTKSDNANLVSRLQSRQAENSEESSISKDEQKEKTTFMDTDDSDDDCLTIKRKNIEIDGGVSEEEEEELKDEKTKSKKAVTKAALAKKLLKKKIKPNKKKNFDDEGQEIVDATKSKVSELARKYEEEDASGINIEQAKEILKEEDRFDKQRFKEKVKEKHREAKRKLKEQRQKQESEDEEDDEGEESDGEKYSDSEDEPDLSWLPDPDEIYGKEEKESDEDRESGSEDEDSNVHRPPKRKLKIQENKSKRKRTSSEAINVELEADEELALQLLRQ